MTTNEQLQIAINGSQQFHAKAASAQGTIPPDPVNDGHRELAVQLKGLAQLFDKTAAYVEYGYPAKAAIAHVAKEGDVDADFVQKLGSCLDALGELVLQELVIDTFTKKVQAKTATAPSERVNAAMRRLSQLETIPRK